MRSTAWATAMLGPVFAFIAPPAAAQTALEQLAATTPPGEWRELTTGNIDPILRQNSRNYLVYTDDIVWDPGSRKFLFIGSDHCIPAEFAVYDTVANQWSYRPRPAWFPGWCDGVMHGYDHGAIDRAHGVYYHRPYNSNQVHRYPISSQTWDSPAMSALPSSYTAGNVAEAIEYFPELGGLVWVRAAGHVIFYNEATEQWSQLASGLALSGTYVFAEYDPVHRVMIFWSSGGGTLYKLDQNRQVTQIQNPPVSLYNGSGYPATLTIDPVSGTYLMLSPDSRQFYTYSVQTNTWQSQSSPTKPNMTNRGVVATPVDTYGVVFFVACGDTSPCHAYVYKHAGSSQPTPPPAPANLQAE